MKVDVRPPSNPVGATYDSVTQENQYTKILKKTHTIKPNYNTLKQFATHYYLVL